MLFPLGRHHIVLNHSFFFTQCSLLARLNQTIWSSSGEKVIECIPVRLRSTVAAFTSGPQGVKTWEMNTSLRQSAPPWWQMSSLRLLETVAEVQNSLQEGCFNSPTGEPLSTFCQGLTAIRSVCLCFDTCHMSWLHASGELAACWILLR